MLTYDDALALVKELCVRLDERARAVSEADDWYEGRHPVPEPPVNTLATVDGEARRAFVEMARNGVTNLLPPIVDVQADGLNVEAFRFGGSAISSDVEAQAVWQRNHMDADHGLLIHDALRTGQGMALVWPGMDGRAQITVEDPAQTIVMYEAGSRRNRRAALKRWTDDAYSYVTLYTPDAIWKFRSEHKASDLLDSNGRRFGSDGSWIPREVTGEPWPLLNPWRIVPVVEVRANQRSRASLYGGGAAEFAKQLTPQRRMNAATMLLLTTMEAQSFRQRWATGWDYPRNDDGSPNREQMIRMAASRVASFTPLEGEKVQVGEFAQADFRPFVDIQAMWVKEMAATSGTPPYAFLLGDMINVASDSLARIEGLKVSKMRAHSLELGEALLEILSLAFRMEDNPKADDVTAQVVWREFEERTATEQANLAVLAKSLGAPLGAVFAMFPGVSQVEAQRWVTESIADTLRAAVVAPTPPQEAPVAPVTEPTPVA